jgi:hypothetical protein
MKKRAVVALSATLLLAGAAHAKEIVRAHAVHVGSVVKSSNLLVTLDRYSTDEERARWRELFAAGGQEALVAKWQEENPRVGTCSFTHTVGYQIRAAISVPTEKGRRIYMATDRPIAGYEVMRGARSQDFPIGWIEVEVDAEGKGEGRFVGAAEFSVEDGRLVMTTLGTEPVRLVDVVVREEK